MQRRNGYKRRLQNIFNARLKELKFDRLFLGKIVKISNNKMPNFKAKMLQIRLTSQTPLAEA